MWLYPVLAPARTFWARACMPAYHPHMCMFSSTFTHMGGREGGGGVHKYFPKNFKLSRLLGDFFILNPVLYSNSAPAFCNFSIRDSRSEASFLETINENCFFYQLHSFDTFRNCWPLTVLGLYLRQPVYNLPKVKSSLFLRPLHKYKWQNPPFLYKIWVTHGWYMYH